MSLGDAFRWEFHKPSLRSLRGLLGPMAAMAALEAMGPAWASRGGSFYLLGVVFATLAGGTIIGLASALLLVVHSHYLWGLVSFLHPREHFLAARTLVFAAPAAAIMAGAVHAHWHKLETQARRLRQAQRIGNFGSWEWDIASDQASWSEEQARIYGRDAGFKVTLASWLSCVHPDDRSYARAAVEKAAQDGAPFSLDYRIIRPDGAVRHVHTKGEAEPGPDGRPRRLSGTVHDVTERKLAQDAEALRRKEAIQRELIANVSHEFRTPLAAIKGFAESLRTGALDDPRTRLAFTKIIEKHAERLSLLVEELLDIAALESGQKPAQSENVGLSDFVWDIASELSPAAARRRIEIRVKVPSGLSVWADKSRLAHALQILCDNAVKYNRHGGRIEICGEAAGQEALIRVKDTGVGIEPEDIPFIFERFHQRKKTRAKIGGAGLNLSLVKSMLESNGGRIDVEKSSPDGTTFRLAVPLAQLA